MAEDVVGPTVKLNSVALVKLSWCQTTFYILNVYTHRQMLLSPLIREVSLQMNNSEHNA